MTFSLPIKQQGVWMPSCRDTNMCHHVFLFFLSFFLSKEIKKVTNLIASALYRQRTELIPTLAFSNTACCIQLQSWSINPRCIQLLDKHLTAYYLYFLNLNIHESLNFVRVCVWCNKIRSCCIMDLCLVWSAVKMDTNNWTNNDGVIQCPNFSDFQK